MFKKLTERKSSRRKREFIERTAWDVVCQTMCWEECHPDLGLQYQVDAKMDVYH